MSIKLSDRERQALSAWRNTYTDYDYLSFNTIAKNSGLDRNVVRRTVRAMARKGVTEFGSGLSNDDGEFAGSGYGLTHAGRVLMESLLPEPDFSPPTL